MGKVRKRFETVIALLLLVTNSEAWAVISKLSDIQFLYNTVMALKPYAIGSLQFVRDWGWVAGIGLLAHIAYESRRINPEAATRQAPIASESPSQAEVANVRRVLEETIKDREDLRGRLGQEIYQAKAALVECKQGFALYRFREFVANIGEKLKKFNAERSNEDQVRPKVRIRFVGYSSGDHGLATEIEAFFRRHSHRWLVTLDGGNNPALRPDPEVKVVFVFAADSTWATVFEVFSQGQFIDAKMTWRDTEQSDWSELVIEVLPTMTA